MRSIKSLATAGFGLLAFLLFALGTPALAQHPHYLHALANLREARELLQTDNRPGFIGERDRAIGEIDRAIDEVRAAVRDEGRNPHHMPPPAELMRLDIRDCRCARSGTLTRPAAL